MRKMRAEHVMLVDLGRNDLGRVADEYGSVKVDDFMVVERFSHRHASPVTVLSARLREGLDCFDALKAVFSGREQFQRAPKVRAMEIIEELEPTRAGSLCWSPSMYFDYSGNLDSCHRAEDNVRSRTPRLHTGRRRDRCRFQFRILNIRMTINKIVRALTQSDRNGRERAMKGTLLIIRLCAAATLMACVCDCATGAAAQEERAATSCVGHA
jgi:hypothetical protein